MKSITLGLLVFFILLASPAMAREENFLLIAQHSGKCAHVEGGSQTDGAPIKQRTCADVDHFKWIIRHVKDGYFHIVSLGSQKCLQVDEASADDGAIISQRPCSLDQRHYQWRLQVCADTVRSYCLVNRASEKCMAARSHFTFGEDGDPITQWDCSELSAAPEMVPEALQWSMPEAWQFNFPNNAVDRRVYLAYLAFLLLLLIAPLVAQGLWGPLASLLAAGLEIAMLFTFAQRNMNPIAHGFYIQIPTLAVLVGVILSLTLAAIPKLWLLLRNGYARLRKTGT